MFYRKRAFETEWGCRRRCGALSIKPLEGSRLRLRRTRSMGIQSIWDWKLLQRRELLEKALLLMFVDILLLGFTPVMVLPSSSSFKQRYRCTYIRGSVRRVSGFVLTSKPEVNFRIANNPLRTPLSAVTVGAPPGSFGSRPEASDRFDARIRSFGERDKPMRARHSAP